VLQEIIRINHIDTMDHIENHIAQKLWVLSAYVVKKNVDYQYFRPRRRNDDSELNL
jgi:hypothetical protein